MTSDPERYQEESKTWESFVDTLQAVLNKHFPCQALNAALMQLRHDTPAMIPLCPMGNLTVTFNFSVALHTDKDVTWAIGTSPICFFFILKFTAAKVVGIVTTWSVTSPWVTLFFPGLGSVSPLNTRSQLSGTRSISRTHRKFPTQSLE